LKIGILGGTFDPIHLGHLCVAEEICEDMALTKVYLIPAALPPHKDTRPVTPFHHRLAMTRIGVEPSPLLEALDLEGRRQGLSYSIETLREIRGLFEAKVDVFFIIGMDAFLEIKTWKEYRRLFDYAHFVVIKRPGASSEKLGPFLASLEAGFEKGAAQGTYTAATGNHLIYREATLMDISSTLIRARVAADRSIRFWVPAGVQDYILQQGLYRTDEGSR
jgi:nicotinate-nucleotide adenylyltransferase